MLRLLSPLLLWAFFKANRKSLKRLLIVAFSYVLMLVIYADFETVFFDGEVLVFKLIKWLMIMVAITHICIVLKAFKSRPQSKQVNHKNIAPVLLTRSQKIINKYKDDANNGT